MSAAVSQESEPGDPVEIVDNAKESRFVAFVGEESAELVYSTDGDRLTIVHTGVPESLSGRGLGGMLVSAALKKAADSGYTIVPVCPFATSWLRKHPEAARGVPIDWRSQ
ncbi:MAG: GNAT family N-acetyltransferase [Acidimicrobiales bacterium]